MTKGKWWSVRVVLVYTQQSIHRSISDQCHTRAPFLNLLTGLINHSITALRKRRKRAFLEVIPFAPFPGLRIRDALSTSLASHITHSLEGVMSLLSRTSICALAVCHSVGVFPGHTPRQVCTPACTASHHPSRCHHGVPLLVTCSANQISIVSYARQGAGHRRRRNDQDRRGPNGHAPIPRAGMSCPAARDVVSGVARYLRHASIGFRSHTFTSSCTRPSTHGGLAAQIHVQPTQRHDQILHRAKDLFLDEVRWL